MMASPTCGKLPEEHVPDMPTVLVTLNRLACVKRHSDTMTSEFSWPICDMAPCSARMPRLCIPESREFDNRVSLFPTSRAANRDSQPTDLVKYVRSTVVVNFHKLPEPFDG